MPTVKALVCLLVQTELERMGLETELQIAVRELFNKKCCKNNWYRKASSCNRCLKSER